MSKLPNASDSYFRSYLVPERLLQLVQTLACVCADAAIINHQALVRANLHAQRTPDDRAFVVI
jgi:hypothetical protein